MLQLDIQNQYDTIRNGVTVTIQVLQLDIQNQYDTIYRKRGLGKYGCNLTFKTNMIQSLNNYCLHAAVAT